MQRRTLLRSVVTQMTKTSAKTPLVSVIIPTYNRADLVGETIRSVLDQTLPDVEIIVIDDGSKDDTMRVLASFGDAIQSMSQPNAGRPTAANRGLSLASGRYINFFDSDDLMLPRKLELQAALLDKNPELGFVYCGFDFFETDANGERQISPKTGDYLQYPPKRGYILDVLMEFDFIPPSTVLARRECFEPDGFGFDPRHWPSDDLDWLLRMNKRAPVDFVDECLCLMRRHGGNTGGDDIGHATMRVLEQHLRDAKTRTALGEIWPRAAGRAYERVGTWHFHTGRHGAARRAFWRALSLSDEKSLRARALKSWLKTMLPTTRSSPAKNTSHPL
jgi:glycosyltransferase involved in cell wall biosynthesis